MSLAENIANAQQRLKIREELPQVAQELYEALRSMGDIHCWCPDCQAERVNAMRRYADLVGGSGPDPGLEARPNIGLEATPWVDDR